MIWVKLNVTHGRELVRLALAAHGGFHGGEGKRLSEFAKDCPACAAIVTAEHALQLAEGRLNGPQLLDLNLGGGRPQS